MSWLGIRVRTRTVWAAIAAAAVAVTAGYAAYIVPVLVAYKAKQLCSGVFVSGHDPRDAEVRLERDDLPILDYIDAAVDPASRSATASFGPVTREALYRGSTGCALAPDGAVPQRGEDTRLPAAPRATATPGNLPQYLDPAVMAVVNRAFEEPDLDRPRRTRAVVVVHDGRIVAERYADGITAETRLLGWSMAKTVMNALAGILVRDGRWSLDMPLPIPEWQGSSDARRGITLDHALRMSTGLAFDEDSRLTWPDVVTMLLTEPDMAAFAAGMPLIAAPGTRWQYASGTSVILARAMREAFPSQADYEAFPRRALFEPLGMTSAVFETDASGTFVGSSLMFASARDWARFGLLYVRDGVWEGTRILPEGWVEYTVTPAPADPSRSYGAHVWLEISESYARSGAPLPADAFHATGRQGQFVTIVPSRGVVVVRLGATRHRGAWDQPAFVSDVLKSLGENRRGSEKQE